MTAGREFLALTVGRGLSAVSSLAWIGVAARLYSVDELSFLARLAVIAAIVETGKGFGLGSVLVRHLPLWAQRPGETDRLVSIYLLTTGSLLSVVMLLAIAAPTRWTWGIAGICLQALFGSWSLILQASSRFVEAAASNTMFGLASRALPAGAAWVFHLDLIRMLQVTAALSCACVIAVMLVYRLPVRHFALRHSAGNGFWHEARPFFWAGWLRYGATQLDQLIAVAVFPALSLAVYFVFRRLYSFAAILIDAGVDVLCPRLVRSAFGDELSARNLRDKAIQLSLPAAIAVALVIVWNRAAIAHWFFGPQYRHDADLIVWLSLAAVLYGLYSVQLSAELAFGRSARYAKLVGLAALINSIASVSLSGLLGTKSLPTAMALAYGAAFVAAGGWRTVVRPAMRLRSVDAATASGARLEPLAAAKRPDGSFRRLIFGETGKRPSWQARSDR